VQSEYPSAAAPVVAAAPLASPEARAAVDPHHAHHHHAHHAEPSAAAQPELIVSDSAVLAQLSERGFDLGSLWLGHAGSGVPALQQHAAYRALVRIVEQELALDRARDPRAGVGMKHPHRQLDAAWLRSTHARFDLIGVINRVDRKVFAPEHCGETRFIYRLAYRAQTASGEIDSRAPFTLNLVDYQEPQAGSCVGVARRWLKPADAATPDAELAWLLSERGPLGPTARASSSPKALELNFQSVRWPSTVRPTMAGHAEYRMLVLERAAQPPLGALPLENQLDAARVGRDPALREALLAFVREPASLVALDEGTLQIPERWLATRATSVAPHGLARLANRPYAQVLRAQDFADLDLSHYRTLRSPAALIRRLDALSCTGCHQSRSLAGFHLLGVEPQGDYVDAISVPMSPHLHEDLDRRALYVTALASGQTPSEQRDSAERSEGHDARGAHCGLGDPGFARWTCASGLRCVPAGDDEVGACAAGGALAVGDPCEHGTLRASSDSHADGMTLLASESCGEGRVCERNGVGFPGGMCAGACDALPAGAVCGGIALLREFNACLAAHTPFDVCLANDTRPGALQACDFKTPCRDDYVCTRTKGLAPETGACLPPYFLFQLRVDGHPL
jgi:hypothetical protein